ncbi:MAG: hypothetical protein H6576_18155 [Lewinellaceae bacterium]|nr:hypothetical protein [Saprospiraceae bacterium]MCB9345615.1 hypothetical protein [Lewinellaceae bacterium]
MRLHLLTGTTAGLLICCLSILQAQTIDSTAIGVDNSPDVENTEERRHHGDAHFWKDARITGGQITLPFKIRKSPEKETFRLTTDVTLGGYVGYTQKLAVNKEYFVTIPLTAGLTFINLNDSNTTPDWDEFDAEVVPGLTWSTGLIFQLDQYCFGLMLGKDYASNVGNEWEHHGKLWWSFGIGFVFLQ